MLIGQATISSSAGVSSSSTLSSLILGISVTSAGGGNLFSNFQTTGRSSGFSALHSAMTSFMNGGALPGSKEGDWVLDPMQTSSSSSASISAWCSHTVDR